MKNFAITGVAGYVAPRHLKAIKDTGNRLVAALDPHDSVGILDRFFNNVSFFTEFERFDRHLENLKRNIPAKKINYLSICSPNNLHDAHIRLALRLGANAICEKPLVINPWNLDALKELEEESISKVYTVLQLRLLPSLIKLKKELSVKKNLNKYDVELTYITPRGLWYSYSWKGNPERSGGISTNIGVHFFDLLLWLFGCEKKCEVHISNSSRAGGFIELENANIKWFLSLNKNDIPSHANESNSTFRSIRVDGKEIEFSKGFTDLHTRVYENILDGNGFGIEDARASIELAYKIRNIAPVSNGDYLHPIVKKILNKKNKLNLTEN